MLGCTNNITAAIFTKKRKMYTADRQTHKAKIFMVYQHFKCYTHTYIHIYSRTYKHTQMHTLTIPTIHKDFLEYEK